MEAGRVCVVRGVCVVCGVTNGRFYHSKYQVYDSVRYVTDVRASPELLRVLIGEGQGRRVGSCHTDR